MTYSPSTKTTYILWVVAGIAVFALIIILGFIFYGFVVPQAQAVSQFGTFVVLGFVFIAGVAAFFSLCPFAVYCLLSQHGDRRAQ
ncbi:hypothetical protein IH779_02095 [Patescibacteria group bacterium]|nr:hypothetical protein [Patescibacteria group bacterium]